MPAHSLSAPKQRRDWPGCSSPWRRRQGCPDALRKIGRIVGCLRGLVDLGAPPQLVERQRGIQPARIVQIAVDQTVEEMPDIEPTLPTRGVRVANDVDRATVAQQMIPLR